MTPIQFLYWLQGFAEIAGTRPTDIEWGIIKEHLGLVFDKVTTMEKGLQALKDNCRPSTVLYNPPCGSSRPLC